MRDAVLVLDVAEEGQVVELVQQVVAAARDAGRAAQPFGLATRQLEEARSYVTYPHATWKGTPPMKISSR